MRSLASRAFTLIELLTVIAITAILMTIIVIPLFDSLNLTRSAQAFSEAQARARVLSEKISEEIGNAASVRSLSLLVPTTLNGNPANVAQNSLIVRVPIQGSVTNPTLGQIEVVLPYVKLDILEPAHGDASQFAVGPNGNPAYLNPNIGIQPPGVVPVGMTQPGMIDPTAKSPIGQVNLPTGIGATMIRYFVGLRDPFSPYNNPYDGILMQQGGRQDNLYSLYRAQIQPFVYRAGTGSNGDISAKFRPNLLFFQSDAVTDTQIIDEDDPRFFLNDAGDNAKVTRIKNWQSASVMMSELSRYDMIQPIYNKYTHVASYLGNAPVVVPLIQFRPTHISDDPAQGQVAVRQGEATNNAAAIAPDVYKTQFPLWTNQIVRVWPRKWDPNSGANPGTFSQYFVGRNDANNGLPGEPPGFSIYYFNPVNPLSSDVTSTGSTEVFDMATYDMVTAQQGMYPFTQAVTQANNRSNWMTNPAIMAAFVPFDVNTAKGKIITSFDISEVGNPNVVPSAPMNLPTLMTSPIGIGPFNPFNDPNLGGNFYDPQFQTVNERFNKVWADNKADDNSNLIPQQVDRFIDLRNTPNSDGTPSPLSPISGFPKAQIVPGSEIVYGPDQMPGPNQGNTVRYTRVTRNPGPNQYEINYVDQPEPFNPVTGLIDYSLIGLDANQLTGFNPNVYNPQNFCSAIIQPRYKKGYIKFNSDPAIPLPLGQIQIDYRFQFNGNQTGSAAEGTAIVGAPSDEFAVDYDTRQLMSVLITLRNYPQTTNIPNPQTVTLKATANLRNYIR